MPVSASLESGIVRCKGCRNSFKHFSYIFICDTPFPSMALSSRLSAQRQFLRQIRVRFVSCDGVHQFIYFSHFHSPFITGIIMFYETFFLQQIPLKCNMRLFTFLQIYRRIKRPFERFFHYFFTLQFYPRYLPVSNQFISLFSFRLQRFRFF